jgi:hypothetical protein
LREGGSIDLTWKAVTIHQERPPAQAIEVKSDDDDLIRVKDDIIMIIMIIMTEEEKKRRRLRRTRNTDAKTSKSFNRRRKPRASSRTMGKEGPQVLREESRLRV